MTVGRQPSKDGPVKRRTHRAARKRAYTDSVQSRRTLLPLHVDRAALRLWRRKRYLGQADLAALLDINWMTVARWELGHSEIPGYLQLVLERLDEIMLWHPDSPRLQDGQVIVPIERSTASPQPAAHG